MTEHIVMPQLGESVTEGTITKWLVEEGDTVSLYEPIAEVMTDKVNAELPSSFSGKIKELLVKEDDVVSVGDSVCTIEVKNSEDSMDEPIKFENNQDTKDQQKEESVQVDNKKRYSPVVLRLSSENQVKLSEVVGSGFGGRITKKDIEAFINKENNDSKSDSGQKNTKIPQEKVAPRGLNIDVDSDDLSREIHYKLTNVRKSIASNMVSSKREAPHAWMMIEVDVTDLVRFREKMKNEFLKREEIKLTFLPFFMKAIVDGLKKYPQVNSKWAEDKIIQYKDVHLSMAVAKDDELYVPVIRHADEKNIRGLARALNDAAQKVRKGSLKPEDTQGGTFTLNNTGSFGSIQSQPIINASQAAIVSVESIVKRPVILKDNDAIAVRHMVNLCMSLDHRVLDGLICGKFMAHIKETLENMNEHTISFE